MADEMQNGNAEVQQAVTAALEQQKKKKKKKRLIIFAVIAALIIIVIALGAGGSDDGGTQTGGTAAGGEQQVSEAPKATDGKLGDYVCTVKSATKCKDWDGRDCVKIVYNFTNNSSNPASFDIALDDAVYQDGIALESSFTSSDDNEILDVEIKPGITKEVPKIYILRNSTSELEVEVGETFSFNDTKYTTTIKF